MGTGSPSRLKARLKGAVRHSGMAPPLRKTSVSRLTRRQVFGEDQIAKSRSIPGLAGRAARPSGGLFRFWTRDSPDANHLRNVAFGTVALVPSSGVTVTPERA